MIYPKQFIAKVKAEFPDQKVLHRELNEGMASVGRFLFRNRIFAMKASDIIKALDEGRQDEIRKAAEKCVHCQKLYEEWDQITCEWLYSHIS